MTPADSKSNNIQGRQSTRRRSDWVFHVGISLAFLTGGTFCALPEMFPSLQETHYRKLIMSLRDRQASAPELAETYRRNYPEDSRGLCLAAEAAVQQGEHHLAIDLYRQLPQDGGQLEFQRELGMGKQLFSTGELIEAENCLRRALQLNPNHLEANNRLGHLLQICGRVWESNPYFLKQIQRGKCRGDELLGASPSDRFFRHDERLTRMGIEPDSPALLIRLAEARNDLFDNREDHAEQLLRDIVDRYPHLGEAQGRLGRIIVDRGDFSEFLLWRGSLQDDARHHPEIHFVEGLQARKLGQLDGAVHSFLKTLELSPNHLGAYIQISSCLDQLGHTEAAKTFSERSTLLSEIDRNYNVLRSSFTQETTLATIALLGKLGRYWEAAGWCYVLTNLDEPAPQSRSELQKWLPLLHKNAMLPTVPGSSDFVLAISEFAPPVWPSLPPRKQSLNGNLNAASEWQFTDDAVESGIQFSYFDGTTREARLSHILNTTGGGIGAIDFDGDGWVDLYLAQGNDWRNPSPQPEWTDRFYRNIQGNHFQDVSLLAGLNEIGYSQGVTVGDFNQDGFSDIHVCNLGPNTLFINNGDGTFADCTAKSGIAGAEWSTSAVFADFSGDGLPDLYVLNYSDRTQTATTECPTAEGVMKACTPDVLRAEHDRCYLNLGDGRFEDVSEAAGVLVPNGRGFGVVAWDFGGQGRISLFVANDTSANFLFKNRGVNSVGVPLFDEIALISGVALDGDGNPQASMGVAAGDANGDGRLDLYITNFFADTNTLYLAGDAAYFSDETRKYRLREQSFWMLGFGCQFADFDGDRWEDLIVANGHVDQISSTGSEDHMLPQLYRNRQATHFDEVNPNELGPYFQTKRLGRAVALLDWNRDGLIDFSVSHLHSPFALVTNKTRAVCRPLTVRVIGRRGCREPIGTTVIARIGTESISRFLTAGNGYMVSNEPILHFSFPGVDEFDELTVRWPDGHEQSWKNVRTGQQMLIIEDREDVILTRLQ